MMQLRHAGRRDRQQPRHLAQRDALQIVQPDYNRLRLGQPSDAGHERAPVLRQTDPRVGPLSPGIGQTLGQGQEIVTLSVFGNLIQRNDLSQLGARQKRGEVVIIETQGLGKLPLGRLTLKLVRETQSNTCNTTIILMHGPGCPIPAPQFIQYGTAYANGAITAKGGTPLGLVTRGCPEITEHAGRLKILMVQMHREPGTADTGKATSPRQKPQYFFGIATHTGY